MDAAPRAAFQQDVEAATPPRGVLSFVKLFFGQAKKSLFNKHNAVEFLPKHFPPQRLKKIANPT